MEYLLDHPWELGLLIALFLATVLELGRQAGAQLRIYQNPSRKEQMAAMRDGLFVLLSLLLGFTMALATPRFADRQSLLVQEALAIGTTYLRAGTLPQPHRDQARNLLRRYVNARLDLNNAGLDAARFTEASLRSKHLQDELWADAAAVAQIDRSPITAAYIDSLNDTIDLDEKRLAALENRIPRPVWFLIGAVSAIAIFTSGLSFESRFWLNLVLVPVTLAIVFALIADLDAPSSGFIHYDQRSLQRLKADLSSRSPR